VAPVCGEIGTTGVTAMPRAGRRRRGELSLSLQSATSEFYVQLPRGGERSSGQARPPAAPSRVNHSLVRPVQPIARGPLGAFVPGRKGYEMALGLLLVLSTVSQRPLPPPQFRTEALRRVDSIATAEFAKDSLGALRSAWFRAPTLFGHSPTVTRIRLAPDWRPRRLCTGSRRSRNSSQQ
jgi:hypothetical protein